MTGRLVAEALPRKARLRLIARLHEHGLTDVEIADVTAYSTYTAARIRRSLGLAPNENGGHTVPDFRVADTAPEHPKLRAAGLPAIGLWAAAGAYAMRELTDGWVPEYWVLTWPSGKQQAGKLVTTGLWDRETRVGIPGFRFHDWTDYQRPASKIHDERAKGRERAQRSRERSPERAGERSAVRSGAVTPDVRSASHDSLSLSLALTPKGSSGGVSPEPNASKIERPPADNLDPNNPRCGQHADIAAGDRGPDCPACGRVRRRLEAQAADATLAELARRKAWRAAVDACSDCDENGKLELPDGSLRRHHEPAAAPS